MGFSITNILPEILWCFDAGFGEWKTDNPVLAGGGGLLEI
jgi:hypothetical protein